MCHHNSDPLLSAGERSLGLCSPPTPGRRWTYSLVATAYLLCTTIAVADVVSTTSPTPPVDPSVRRTRSVKTTFESVDAIVAAEWDFPERGPAPLVVLIPPAGRIDRNGLRPGSDTDPEQGMYARLTNTLVTNGFAVFRYDQPGAGRSSPGRFATDRSTALEGYTRAVDHARIDPDQIFLVGHASGTTTIAAIYPRFASVQPPAGVVLLDSAVGEHDALRIRAPLLIVNPNRDPDNRYQYGEYVVETRARSDRGELETKFVLVDDALPGLIQKRVENGKPVLAIHRHAIRALLDWLRRHRR